LKKLSGCEEHGAQPDRYKGYLLKDYSVSIAIYGREVSNKSRSYFAYS